MTHRHRSLTPIVEAKWTPSCPPYYLHARATKSWMHCCILIYFTQIFLFFFPPIHWRPSALTLKPDVDHSLSTFSTYSIIITIIIIIIIILRQCRYLQVLSTLRLTHLVTYEIFTLKLTHLVTYPLMSFPKVVSPTRYFFFRDFEKATFSNA